MHANAYKTNNNPNIPTLENRTVFTGNPSSPSQHALCSEATVKGKFQENAEVHRIFKHFRLSVSFKFLKLECIIIFFRKFHFNYFQWGALTDRRAPNQITSIISLCRNIKCCSMFINAKYTELRAIYMYINMYVYKQLHFDIICIKITIC